MNQVIRVLVTVVRYCSKNSCVLDSLGVDTTRLDRDMLLRFFSPVVFKQFYIIGFCLFYSMVDIVQVFREMFVVFCVG